MHQRVLAVLAAVILAAAACGSSDSETTPTTAALGSTTTAAAPASTITEAAPTSAGTETTVTPAVPTTTEAANEVLHIVLGNDDGIGAPGIDALAQALMAMDDVTVTIVAPAEEKSGSGGSVTEGLVEATDATTASGLEATAVDGFPADAVVWALDNVEPAPHVVVTGSNSGQNFGPLQALSGTVGAARQAAQLGTPAVAVSQGVADTIVFDASVTAAIDWIDAHRDEYLAGTVTLFSINSPTCPDGPQGVVEVPWGPEWNDRGGDVVCDSTLEPLTDDIDAFLNGWTAISELAVAG